ncbi:glycosyltransferase family 4 protein [Candidatus Bathyarchaeota archaeon]|nr:glycosyltransferase family 4 protein [Candidatus Bathyarchaeota archaeon]
MKIVMIEKDLSIRSGSRRFILEATHRLESLGHKVKIFTSKMDRETCFEPLLHLPIQIVPVKSPHISHALKPVIDVDYFWPTWQMAMETSQRIAEWNPDVVLLHYTGEPWLPPYFYYLDKSVGAVCLHTPPRGIAPFIGTTAKAKIGHELFNLPPLSKWKAQNLKKLAMIISHSLFMQEYAIRIQSKTRLLTSMVPLGIDHSEFYPTGEEEPYVLCVARIDPRKRLELAIHAMKNVDSKYSLVLAGSVEKRFQWYKNMLLELAKELGISQRISIIEGLVSAQIVRLMQRCSVFLFPSTNDTFGVAVLEAMSCGKPIIASRAGGVPELLDDCGILIDPTPEQWQKTLRNVLSDSTIRKDIGEKAFKRSQLYSWDETVHSLLQTIEKIRAYTT